MNSSPSRPSKIVVQNTTSATPYSVPTHMFRVALPTRTGIAGGLDDFLHGLQLWRLSMLFHAAQSLGCETLPVHAPRPQRRPLEGWRWPPRNLSPCVQKQLDRSLSLCPVCNGTCRCLTTSMSWQKASQAIPHATTGSWCCKWDCRQVLNNGSKCRVCMLYMSTTTEGTSTTEVDDAEVCQERRSDLCHVRLAFHDPS